MRPFASHGRPLIHSRIGRRLVGFLGLSVPLLCVVGLACRGPAWRPAVPARADLSGLTHVVFVTDRVLSGSVPDADRGFTQLRDLGVQTIVSVDGNYPDAEAARHAGIRTVHLPLRYDDVPRQHMHSLLRVLDEFPGRVYVHCFHGKHRAPAAAAAALVAAGELTPEAGVSYMRQAGTSQHYRGLYGAVRFAAPLSESERASVRAAPIPERANVSSFAEGMSRLAKVESDLSILEGAAWSPVREHPDLDSRSEVQTLLQLLEELAQTPHRRFQSADFEDRWGVTLAAARELEGAVVSDDVEAASQAFRGLQDSCVDCHAVYRDRKW